MYAKLILRNARRSLGDYLIYIVTLTLCVAMFYAFLSISSSYYRPDIGAEFDLSLLGDNMKAAICCITVLLLFLIKYVNTFMLLRRQREFAVQTVMGMERKTTALMFFAETLIMGAAALVAGILGGALLAQMITAMQLSSFGYPYQVTWTLYPDTCLLTAVFFLLSFTVIGILNIRSIRRIKVIDMLQADQINETHEKSRWIHGVILLFVLCLVMMTVTGIQKKYYYSDPRMPLPVHVMFYANILVPGLGLLAAAGYLIGRLRHKCRRITCLTAVLLALDILLLICSAGVPVMQQKYLLSLGQGSINTYAMFMLIEMSFAVCALFYLTGSALAFVKGKSLACRYREENLFLFGQLLTKLKTTTKTMTLICLTLLVSICLFISIPALVGWAEGYLKERSVFGVRMASTYNHVYDPAELPSLEEDYAFAGDFLEKEGIGIADDCAMSLYFPKKEQFHDRLKTEFPILAMSLSDYNHLRKMTGTEPIWLQEGTFTTQWRSTAVSGDIETFLQSHSAVETDAGALTLANEKEYHAGLSETIYNLYTDVIYIFPDSVCEELTGAQRHRYINTVKPMPYSTAKQLEELFEKTLCTDLTTEGVSYLIRTASTEISDTRTGNFILKTSMTYGAVLLFISCFTILALQQLMDASHYRSRFGILRQLGVEDKKISRLIRKQLAFWFGLPVCVAAAGAAIFAVYFFRTISVQITAYVGVSNLLYQILAVVLILVILLAGYFITTLILFRQMIFEKPNTPPQARGIKLETP